MLRKMMIATVFGLATIGAAAAQSSSGGSDTNATDNKTGAEAAPGIIDNAEIMKPFYTDETMTTIQPATEFGEAVKALNTNDRDKIAQECQNSTTQRASFCKAFNDANKM